MIFGIFGEFRIDIVKNKFGILFFQNTKESEQENQKLFSEIKNFRKKIYGKVNENLKIQKLSFFAKKVNFLIWDFH